MTRTNHGNEIPPPDPRVTAYTQDLIRYGPGKRRGPILAYLFDGTTRPATDDEINWLLHPNSLLPGGPPCK